MPGGGPLASGWLTGNGGAGNNGAALTSPTPLVSPDMPIAATDATPAAMRLKFTIRVPSQILITLVTNCTRGYAENRHWRTRSRRLTSYKAQTVYLANAYF
jgi:hypothetical protein